MTLSHLEPSELYFFTSWQTPKLEMCSQQRHKSRFGTTQWGFVINSSGIHWNIITHGELRRMGHPSSGLLPKNWKYTKKLCPCHRGCGEQEVALGDVAQGWLQWLCWAQSWMVWEGFSNPNNSRNREGLEPLCSGWDTWGCSPGKWSRES